MIHGPYNIKFITYDGTRRFTTLYTRARHLSPSGARSVHPTETQTERNNTNVVAMNKTLLVRVYYILISLKK